MKKNFLEVEKTLKFKVFSHYRTLFLAFLVVLVLLSSLVSCKKEKFEALKPELGLSIMENMGSEIPLIPNPRPISDYFLNIDDPDEEKMARQLYEIAIIARPFFARILDSTNLSSRMQNLEITVVLI